MLRVGITGGIGSGKTEVRKLFARSGFPTLSADELAKTISNRNSVVRRRIIRLLGSDAYQANGTLNRPIVAERVFGNRKKERALNAIIHPYVLREVKERFAALERKGAPVALVEAALIYEAGLDRDLDFVIMVDARRDLRTRRVLKRDQTSAHAIGKRMAAQWSTRRKKNKSQIILRNNGTPGELRSGVLFLASLFQLIAGSQ